MPNWAVPLCSAKKKIAYRWIDFLRSTRDESGNQRRNHAGMLLADPNLFKFGARG